MRATLPVLGASGTPSCPLHTPPRGRLASFVLRGAGQASWGSLASVYMLARSAPQFWEPDVVPHARRRSRNGFYIRPPASQPLSSKPPGCCPPGRGPSARAAGTSSSLVVDVYVERHSRLALCVAAEFNHARSTRRAADNGIQSGLPLCTTARPVFS